MQPYKKRRITPRAGYGTISAAAMASTFNKPATKGEVAVLKRQVAVLKRNARTTELKHEDSAVSFAFDATGEVPATGQWTQGCIQGTGDTERIGNKITVKGVQFRGSVLYSPAAAVNTATIVYMFIVWDKQCNGAAAAALDVFTSANFALALRNTDNLRRFQILWQQAIPLQPTLTNAANLAGPVTVPISFYKKVNIPVTYDASAGAITDLTSNNIFLMAGSDGNSDDVVTCAGTGRLWFTDD